MSLPFKKWVHIQGNQTYKKIRDGDASLADTKRFPISQFFGKQYLDATGDIADGWDNLKSLRLETGGDPLAGVAVMYDGSVYAESHPGTRESRHYVTDPITRRNFRITIEPYYLGSFSARLNSPAWLKVEELEYRIAHSGDFETTGSLKIRKTTEIYNNDIVGQAHSMVGDESLYQWMSRHDDWEDEDNASTFVPDTVAFYPISDAFVVNNILYIQWGNDGPVISVDIDKGTHTDDDFQINKNILASRWGARSGWGPAKMMCDRRYLYLYYAKHNRLSVLPLVYNKYDAALAVPEAIKGAVTQNDLLLDGTNRYFDLDLAPYGNYPPTAIFWEYNERGYYTALYLLIPSVPSDRRSNFLTNKLGLQHSVVRFDLNNGRPVKQSGTFQQVNDGLGGTLLADDAYFNVYGWATRSDYPAPVRHGSLIVKDVYDTLSVSQDPFFVKLLSRETDQSELTQIFRTITQDNPQGVIAQTVASPDLRLARVLLQPSTFLDLWNDPFGTVFEFNVHEELYRVIHARQQRENMWDCLCSITGISREVI